MRSRRFSFLALLLLGVPACGGHHPDAAEASPAAAEAQLTPAQLSFLKFGEVVELPTPDIGDLSGTIDFDDQRTARLSAVVPGRVAELLVQVGDHVAADQPLIAFDSAEVKTAQAEYVRAQADRTVASKAAERAERLRAARAVADKDYLQAKEDAEKAEADFARARAQLERLRVTPGEPGARYFLRAPFAGTVVERKALVGMEVGSDSAEPLLVVSDLAAVRVVVRVPERQLGLVQSGQGVTVRVDAYPQEFAGLVTAVGDVVEDATQTVPVRCMVPNPDHLLKPAMFARVTLKASAARRLMAVPASAVLSDGERFRLIVRRADGSLELHPVEVGAEMGDRVQVLSGVGVGDEIVTEGALFAARALTAS